MTKSPNCIYEATGLPTYKQKRLRLYAILAIVAALLACAIVGSKPHKATPDFDREVAASMARENGKSEQWIVDNADVRIVKASGWEKR